MPPATSRLAIGAAYASMCLIWGTTWLGIKISLRYVPPIAGAGLRFVLAGLAMYVAAAALRKLPRAGEIPWKLVAVLAAFWFGFNYVLTYLAETHVDSGLTAVLFGVLPFFVFAFGHYMLDERARVLTWTGALISFSGVALISLRAGLHGSFWYALAAVLAAVVSAFASVFAKRHAGHDPLVTLPPAMLAGGVMVTIVGFWTERVDVHRALSLGSLEAIVYLAAAGSCLAFFLNLWLLRRVSAWAVGLSSLISPVIAVLVGVLFGSEHVGVQEVAGATLVIAGVWLALRTGSPAPQLQEP